MREPSSSPSQTERQQHQRQQPPTPPRRITKFETYGADARTSAASRRGRWCRQIENARARAAAEGAGEGEEAVDRGPEKETRKRQRVIKKSMHLGNEDLVDVLTMRKCKEETAQNVSQAKDAGEYVEPKKRGPKSGSAKSSSAPP